MKTQNITIIGLRRTGASIALALKASPVEFTLIGNDSDQDLQKQALESGAVDKVESNLIRAASAADILVLAMPSVQLEGTLRVIGGDLQEHTLVIDLTALKGPGVKFAEKYMQKGHYIGARPVFSAGTFSDGLAEADKARSDLFNNSVFCLMPGVQTDPQAVETAVNFGRLLGASPYFVDPLEYDSLAQGVESMPGLIAASVFASINKTVGWRDILRFADLPFATMTMPLETEADELTYLALNDKLATLRWIDALMAEITDLRRLVYEGNAEVLTALLEEMDEHRARWLHERTENDWLEIKDPAIETPGMGQRFLGGLANLGGSR
jgi:prephenate dehydrogenase